MSTLDGKDLLGLAEDLVREVDLKTAAGAEWMLPDDLRLDLADADQGRWVVTVGRGSQVLLDLDATPRTVRRLVGDIIRGDELDAQIVDRVAVCRVGQALDLRGGFGHDDDGFLAVGVVRHIEAAGTGSPAVSPRLEREHPERTFEQLLDSVNPVEVRPPPMTGASRAPRFFGYTAPTQGLTAEAQRAELDARSLWLHGIVLDDAEVREGWARLEAVARPGDVVFIARPDVFGDTTAQIWGRVNQLEARGARVIILKIEPPAVSMRPTGTTMVVGDVHGDLGWIKSVLERAHRLGVDTVLSVGDWGIGPWPGDTPGSRFTAKTERIAAANGVTCYIVPGNHENYDSIAALTPRSDGWLEPTEHVLVAPRGHRWTWDGVTFGALGGAFSVDWRHRTPARDWWIGAEELQPEDVEQLGSGDLDVLVSHDVPSGIPVGPGGLFSPHQLPAEDVFRAQVSRDLLLEAVKRTRPELVLAGHWHQRLSSALPADVAARDNRPTVGERTLGYVDAARRGRIGVEVLDMQRTDRNWVLLDLADLAITEQATAIARARDRADR